MARSFGEPGKNQPPKGGGRRWRAPNQDLQSAPAVQPQAVDVNKRAVALVIDAACAYFLSAILSLMPFLNRFLTIELTMCAYFLIRDFLYDGRGVGKNLMGLQVVDVQTGDPANLLQSVKRNIILIAPMIILELVTVVLHFVPIAWLNAGLQNLVTMAGTIYCIIVIPMEGYRAYSREDGLRLGDVFAGTTVIEAPMDFSNLFPRGRLAHDNTAFWFCHC